MDVTINKLALEKEGVWGETWKKTLKSSPTDGYILYDWCMHKCRGGKSRRVISSKVTPLCDDIRGPNQIFCVECFTDYSTLIIQLAAWLIDWLIQRVDFFTLPSTLTTAHYSIDRSIDWLIDTTSWLFYITIYINERIKIRIKTRIETKNYRSICKSLYCVGKKLPNKKDQKMQKKCVLGYSKLWN